MVNNENKKKHKRQRNKMGFLVKYNPAPLAGAKKMSSLLVWQPDFFFFSYRFSIYVHSVILLPQLIALAFASLKLLNVSPLCFYICFPDVLNSVLSIRLSVQSSHRVLQKADAVRVSNQLIRLCSYIKGWDVSDKFLRIWIFIIMCYL